MIAELKELQIIGESDESGRGDSLLARYGDLYRVVKRLPSRTQVDSDEVLRRHLSDYIHELQKVAEVNKDWEMKRIAERLRDHPLQRDGVVSLERFRRYGNGGFEAKLGIADLFDKGRRYVEVSADSTIGNMPALRAG